MTPPVAGRTVQLSHSGHTARIVPDGFSASGRILEIGGAEQSHVDPARPEYVLYEYLRRIANLVDTVGQPGEPITVAHLGAGALTLPRYVAATRPGSRQVAVEIERELPSLVLSELPLPVGADVRFVHDDARAALPGLAEALGGGAEEGIDLVVVDIFSGRDSPEHLACREFYAEALPMLSARGILVVNVGDDPGLRFFAEQARAMNDASLDAAVPGAVGGLSGAWTLTDATMLDGRHEGNLILAAGPGVESASADAGALVDRLEASGPHPAAVLGPGETQGWAERLLR